MKKLLVVCMGNICRSPMALTVLRSRVLSSGLTQQVSIDSAGTHASAYAEKPDARAEAALLRRGYEPGRLRSRKVSPQDFQKFDAILGMDASNIKALQQICPPEFLGKLHLYLEFGAPLDGAAISPNEVPDPYYGNPAGFEHVLDLCELGASRILTRLSILS